MGSPKYHLTSTDIFQIFLIFGILFVLLSFTDENPFETFVKLFLLAIIMLGILLFVIYIFKYFRRVFNNLCNSIKKRIQKKKEKQKAIEREKARVVNKINDFIENSDERQDKPSGEEKQSGTILEIHPFEYEDLDPGFDQY